MDTSTAEKISQIEDQLPRPPGEEGNLTLEVEDLRTYFYTDKGVAKAVDGVSWSIPEGKTLGIVGESGCGKSVTALSILRLVESPPGRIEGGKVQYRGTDLMQLSESEMRNYRGNNISMIFQEPMSSLNPVYTVGNQIREAIQLHQGKGKAEARELAIEMLDKVNIPDPEQRVDEYPYQMSGGMKQRAMIAMALSCDPDVLIADEPTTALDVTIQAQLLELLNDLQEDLGMSILLITHDLGVVAELADYVGVMYSGKIQEFGTTHDIFYNPIHPYTQGLFKSRPRIKGDKTRKLSVIDGSVPDATHFPPGCRFHPRCPDEMDHCSDIEPPLVEVESGQWARCLLYEDAYDLQEQTGQSPE